MKVKETDKTTEQETIRRRLDADVRRSIRVPDGSVAIQLGKIKGVDCDMYEPITFKNPEKGTRMYVHRWSMIGYVLNTFEKTDFFIDILADNGDILETYPITKHGFDRIKYKLRPKRLYV